MRVKRPDLAYLGLIAAALLVIAGLTWVNFRFATQNPGGNDFIPRWVGTRLFLTEGLSPYSEETSVLIQDYLHGRLAQGQEDKGYFVYPHYAMLVFTPFGLVSDYSLARALWMTALEMALLGITFASLSLLRWRPSASVFGVMMLFTLIWYHGARPVINGNAAVLSAFFIVAAFLNIRAGRDILAGIILAFASIKPQMVILLVPFVVLWSISHRRMRLVNSIAVSFLVLISVSMLIQPDWIIANLQQVMVYPTYSPPGTPAVIFAGWWGQKGEFIGYGLSVFLGVVLLWEWAAAWQKNFKWFFWTACLTLVITNLIGIRTATSNYIALFPALVLVLYEWVRRWHAGGRWMAIAVMLGLLVGLWALFVNTVQPGVADQPVQHPVLFFPLPALLILGLYWVRWWAIRAPSFGLEDLNPIENL
ncbi:MAG: DUF2029 domain-containing protein [Anaerolineae bacterium]|nr:DUF2029 domain-containing protein [Anaerolineae bacterium]